MSESETEENQFLAENEPVICAICYAYKVDSYSPTFLSRGDQIFEINAEEDVTVTVNETVDMKLQYSDTNFTAAQWASANMKVEGHFKAFSGAASMAVETTEDSKYHTVRVDAIGVCTKNCITSKGNFATQPEKFLTDAFKEAVVDMTPEEIESRVGVFYPIRLQLGGMVKRSYIMEATEEDSEAKVTAELQAAFGKECIGASVASQNSFERGRRAANKNAKIRREWKAQGGKTDLWFKVGQDGEGQTEFTTAMKIAQDWSKTIDNTNVYPFDFELRPLWELIAEIDAEKAQEFKSYLEEKWEKNGNRHLPTMFLPSKLRVAQIPDTSKAFIENTFRVHKSVLVSESANAQGFLDNPLRLLDKKFYKGWKEAAESGIKEAQEIREIICNDADVTVEDLIDQLDEKSDERLKKSQRYLGFWGHDSKESNRIEKLNKGFLDKIIKRLRIDLTCQMSVEDWHGDLDECKTQVDEAVEWFDDNLKCMKSEERKADVTRAIQQVKGIQESLTGFLKRLEAESQTDDDE